MSLEPLASTVSRRTMLTGAAALPMAAVAVASHSAAEAAAPSAAKAGDQGIVVTLLGTGSPVPSAQRFGFSTLVQAGGLNLVFDAGRGCTIRLAQIGVPFGSVDAVFLTHFHSDHVNGLADLWMSSYIPALGGRSGAFQLYGPKGTKNIGDGLMQAFRGDIDARVADAEVRPDSTIIETHEFADDGIIFNQLGVRVRMFEVEHDPKGAIKPAKGYRVDYAGHSVLLSGDTRPTANVLKYGKGVDVLIHEVADFPDPTLPLTQNVYAHHTNPRQAGEIFSKTRPTLAVYSHIVRGAPPRKPNVSLETIVERTRETYSGPLTVGEDLMKVVIDEGIVTVIPHYAEPQ